MAAPFGQYDEAWLGRMRVIVRVVEVGTQTGYGRTVAVSCLNLELPRRLGQRIQLSGPLYDWQTDSEGDSITDVEPFADCLAEALLPTATNTLGTGCITITLGRIL